MNRKFVDEFAVEFCLSMNFKGNRARLARALFNVDKNRHVFSQPALVICTCMYMYVYSVLVQHNSILRFFLLS